MKLYTPENMRNADRYASEVLGVPVKTLMLNAGMALYDALQSHLGKGKRFVILCGKGNNGGDGYALAKLLSENGEDATILSVNGNPKSEEAAYYCDLCKEKSIPFTDAEKDFAKAEKNIREADVLADCLFGTGFSGKIEKGSLIGKILCLANNADAFRLAADVPSGVCADDGSCADITFRADLTVTFAGMKTGLMSYPAREYCGKTVVGDIVMPQEALRASSEGTELYATDEELIKSLLPKRPENSHKGTFGKLLALCGSENMTGAATLSLLGALRCGVGLACLAAEKAVTDSVKVRLAEPIYLPLSDTADDSETLSKYAESCSAVLIGCGLGKSDRARERAYSLIRNCECPILLDADGINLVSENIDILSEAKKIPILTPHPLEFSRLCGKSVDHIQKHRIEAASEFAHKYRCVLLLKGASTVICDENGSAFLNTTGCSALAKGGSGDVLSGMIAAFLAEGVLPLDAALLGAYLHGKAGEELAKEYSEFGVLPSELPAMAARLLARYTGKGTES